MHDVRKCFNLFRNRFFFQRSRHKASFSIEMRNIPLAPEPNTALKSTNKLCDSSNSYNSNVIMRRTSNLTNPKCDNLTNLENGIKVWNFPYFCFLLKRAKNDLELKLK